MKKLLGILLGVFLALWLAVAVVFCDGVAGSFIYNRF